MTPVRISGFCPLTALAVSAHTDALGLIDLSQHMRCAKAERRCSTYKLRTAPLSARTLSAWLRNATLSRIDASIKHGPDLF